MLFKSILLYVILLVSLGLFNIKFLPNNFILLLQFLAVSFMVFAIITRNIYGWENHTNKRNFILPVIFILTGVFLSSITAFNYHNQPFLITFWAQAPMYWFVFYIFLSINNYKKEELEKALIVFAFLHFLFFLLQYIAYPNVLFNVRISEDLSRNALRIFIPGYTILTVGFCLVMNRFLNTNKLVYLILMLLFLSVPVLQATRQSIFVLLLVTIYAIIFSKKVKSRTLIIFLLALSILPLYFIFQDIILNLLELTADIEDDGSFSAREVAILYFLTDFFPADIAYILGNGADHMRSQFGIKVQMLRSMGLYQSDIGLLGEYTRYGAFFVFGVIIIIYKLLTVKTSPELYYIRYYGLSLLLLIPLQPSYTSPSAIAVLCVLFYISDNQYNNISDSTK